MNHVEYYLILHNPFIITFFKDCEIMLCIYSYIRIIKSTIINNIMDYLIFFNMGIDNFIILLGRIINNIDYLHITIYFNYINISIYNQS